MRWALLWLGISQRHQRVRCVWPAVQRLGGARADLLYCLRRPSMRPKSPQRPISRRAVTWSRERCMNLRIWVIGQRCSDRKVGLQLWERAAVLEISAAVATAAGRSACSGGVARRGEGGGAGPGVGGAEALLRSLYSIEGSTCHLSRDVLLRSSGACASSAQKAPLEEKRRAA